MLSKDVIKKYFDDPKKAEGYIRNRLLEDYSKAPPDPPTSGWASQMVHAMDVLKIIFGELPVHEKKNQFSKKQYLDVCLKCYLEWGDTTAGKDNVPENRARGIYNLTHVITALAEVNRIPKTFKERLVRALGLDDFPVKCFPDKTEASIYADKLHLAEYWELKGWEPESRNWRKLVETLMNTDVPMNVQHASAMMMSSKYVDWDASITARLFAWRWERLSGPLRNNILREYLCIRLNQCEDCKSEDCGKGERCFEILRQHLREEDNRVRARLMNGESHNQKEAWQEWLKHTKYARKVLEMALDVPMSSKAPVLSKSTESHQTL